MEPGRNQNNQASVTDGTGSVHPVVIQFTTRISKLALQMELHRNQNQPMYWIDQGWIEIKIMRC
uniref:Uncharacterized protein n=1 Tax=Loa loa TaxID=7209 RepID=A0A1I7VAK4_LOALO